MQDLIENIRKVMQSKEITVLIAAFFGGLASVILGSVNGDSRITLFQSIGIILIATCSGVVIVMLLFYSGMSEELGVAAGFVGGVLWREFYSVIMKIGKVAEKADIETILSFFRGGRKK